MSAHVCASQEELANILTSWERRFRRKVQWKERLKVNVAGDFIEETNEQVHPSSAKRCEVVKAKSNIEIKSL